jgi:hypothetical protein
VTIALSSVLLHRMQRGETRTAAASDVIAGAPQPMAPVECGKTF